jgi:transcription termination/antitermination protein NusG
MSKAYRMMHDGPLRKRPLMPARQARPLKEVDRTKESPLMEPPGAELWRVIMTEPRREKLAIEELRRAGYDAWYPQETVWVRKANKHERARVNQPLFPRYVFVALRSNATKAIRDCKHVTALLPYRPASALISNLYDRQQGREFDAERAERDYRKSLEGKTLPITDGPFASFDGIVTRAEHERLIVLVNIFGRMTEVALDYSQIAA